MTGTIRILAIQSTPHLSSEVRVFGSLLRAGMDQAVDAAVLLVQGTDSSRPNGTEAIDYFSGRQGVTVIPLEMGPLGLEGLTLRERILKVGDLERLALQMRRVLTAVDQFHPSVVYSSQQHWDQLIASRLSRRLRRPRVMHLHYVVGPWLRRPALRSLVTADMVIAVSDYIRAQAIRGGARADRVHTLYNPVETPPVASDSDRGAARVAVRQDLNLSQDALIVGMVSRLSPSKCQIELLSAMSPLLRSCDRANLVLAGSEFPAGNGMGDRLLQMADRDGVADQVHILGHRTDVPELLEGFDIFAHPTRYEPCALSVLEAMSHGLPVVAWCEGGTAELISHPDTGLLVPPADVPALRGALSSLMASPASRANLGSAARCRAATRFAPEEASLRFFHLLSQVTTSTCS